MGESRRDVLKPFLIACVVAVSLWLLTLWGVPMLFPDNQNAQGLFGDMFGSVNALFSALALAGVVVSLYFQRRELHLTVKELKKSAEAQHKSQAALTDSVKAQQEATTAMRGQRTALLHVAKVLGQNGRLESLATIIQGYGHDQMVRINGTPPDKHYGRMWELVKKLEKEREALYRDELAGVEGNGG